MKRLLIGLGLVSLAVCGSAAAQQPNQGLLNAVSYERIPAGTAVTVSPLDNSDDNLILQKRFEEELRARGYAISGDAPLVFTFDIRDTVGAYLAGNVRHVIELSGGGGRGGGEDAKARLNVFDSGGGGLLNEGADPSDTTIVTQAQYRLDATLDERASGRRLWQVWATADLEQSDGLTLTMAMVPVIAQHVGQTVRQKPFPVE
ncbi:MAG: hypothetical protein RBS99_02460 [Rhodospirillales bacterium]|jgi:hypothetical protein|nr:hypothetical protein [Rhodospirillales bacterium]